MGLSDDFVVRYGEGSEHAFGDRTISRVSPHEKCRIERELFADDVRLYGVKWTPFEGKAAVLAVFAMLQDVIEDLEYVAEYEDLTGSPCGCEATSAAASSRACNFFGSTTTG